MNGEEEIVESATFAATTARRGAAYAEFEKRRLARKLAVPTDDWDVKTAFRKRDQPICLFGEDAHDRRERLRGFLVEEVVTGETSVSKQESAEKEEKDEATGHEKDREEEFYTEGAPELKDLRTRIARGSLLRTAIRLKQEREERGEGGTGDGARAKLREAEYNVVSEVANMGMLSSSSGNPRPLTCISTTGDSVVTGALDGAISKWSLPSCARVDKLQPHSARVSNVRFDVDGKRLLSCSADKSAKMFVKNGDDRFAHRLTATLHGGRVSDAHFHPWINDLYATASYDGRFILSSVEKGPLLTQDTGHPSGVHSMIFDKDGALLLTGGVEGGIRMWDLRSGRCILTFQGAHAEGVLSLGFRGGGGRVLVSCSADHSCKVWDLRKTKPIWTIPAHHGVVSGIGFLKRKTDEHLGALGLVTSGYDGKVKVWAPRRGWAFVKGWSCESRIMGIDVGERGIVVAGWDRKWRWFGLDRDARDTEMT